MGSGGASELLRHARDLHGDNSVLLIRVCGGEYLGPRGEASNALDAGGTERSEAENVQEAERAWSASGDMGYPGDVPCGIYEISPAFSRRTAHMEPGC